MILLIETASVRADYVAVAVKATFTKRKTHPIPMDLSDPPHAWEREFVVLAAEAQLHATRLDNAIDLLRSFWQQVTAHLSTDELSL